MNIFIGIEGHSFSGKTTLINDLEKTGKVNVIKEHDIYAGGSNNFPNIKSQSLKKVEEDVKFFLDLEIKRCKDAKEIFEKNGKPTIMDRTIISVVLFQKYLFDNRKDWLNGYKMCLKAYQEAIDKGDIFIPSRIIHLESKDEKTFIKRSKRSVSIDFYKTVKAFRYMQDHYNYITENYFSKGSYINVKSKDVLKGRENVKKQTMDYAFQSDTYTGTDKLFTNFKINL